MKKMNVINCKGQLIVLFLCLSFGTQAQITFHSVLSTPTISTPPEEGLNAIEVDVDQNYVSLGWVDDFDSTKNSEFYLVKTNPKGELIWSKTYGTPFHDKGYDLLIDSNGDYVLAGGIEKKFNDQEILLIKTDSSGNVLWSKRYEVPGVNRLFDIENANDGSYIMCGNIYRNSNTEAFVSKISKTGDIIWNKIFVNGAIDIKAIHVTDQDEIIVVGDLRGGNMLMKLDKNGNIIWEKELSSNGPGGLRDPRAVTVDNQGKIVVSGMGRGQIGSFHYEAAFILVADNLGEVEWAKNYFMEDDFVGYDIEIADDGNYLVAAGHDFNSSLDPPNGYVIFKTTRSGSLLWTNWIQSYISAEHDHVDLETTSDGIIYATKHEYWIGNDRLEDGMINKLDAVNTPTPCFSDVSFTIVPISSFSVDTIGFPLIKEDMTDSVWVVHSQNIATSIDAPCKNVSLDEPEMYSTISLFPNPNKGILYISGLVDRGRQDVTATLYDCQGKLVHKTLLKYSENRLTLPKIPDGIYLVKLSSQDVNVSRKVVLQR